MSVAITCVSSSGRELRTTRSDLLGAHGRDRAREESNRWIKRLRLVRYGADTMRERFTYRGDSLWWFTELYLHKMRRLDGAVATVLALEAAREQHEPARIIVDGSDDVARVSAAAFAQAAGIPVDIRGPAPAARDFTWSSYLIGTTARLSRLRPTPALEGMAHPHVVAFMHTAFWTAPDVQRERYVGPVLEQLAERLTAADLFFVGVGPRRNFRARRWWDPIAPGQEAGPPVTPIERLAPRKALDGSLDLWRRRRQLAKALSAGEEIREAAIYRGCDLWAVLSAELEAVALLQWPWSARAMDEAGSALDVLEPPLVLTYAEAGGWGRAILLEARRRGVRSVGLQHGFIYRHWLNYLHEPDEMAPAGADAGFPRPDRTLLFDGYAAEFLERAGNYPAESLAVTGSAQLDQLAARLSVLRSDRAGLRRRWGVPDDSSLVVLAAKFAEIRDTLPALVLAVARRPDIHLLIKTHPAETPAVYESSTGGWSNVSIAPAEADLASLLAAADGLVTMNSTVGIDAAVLGVPVLVVGLPNNLSPFVSAGVMLGAESADAIPAMLEALLYDLEVRGRLAAATQAFVARYALTPDGQAAVRAADAILALAR